MDERIGVRFLEETRYERMGSSDQEKGLPQPPLQTLLGTSERIELPDPHAAGLENDGLPELLSRRTSLRTYTGDPLSLEELAFLLWSTQGVRKVNPDRWSMRIVPSAGARHALETVLLVNRVDGLAPGLYQYLALDHQLAPMPCERRPAEALTEACLGQSFIEASAVTFAWVADRYRMAWRYGERGTRYLHLDAGHVCQNMYLAAEAIGAGACAIGAYDDGSVDALLGLDGVERFTIYLAAVGKRGRA